MNEYYKANSDKIIAYQKTYREANAEKLREKAKARYEANKEQLRAQYKARYEANREAMREKEMARYRANREARIVKMRAYRLANLEAERSRDLRKKYGITLDDVRKLEQLQDYRCAICRTPFALARAHVDHDHDTGAIRGLLCTKCNTGIGLFQENPKILSHAIKYLKQAKANGNRTQADHRGNSGDNLDE